MSLHQQTVVTRSSFLGAIEYIQHLEIFSAGCR